VFFIILGFIAMICFVAFVVVAFGFGTFGIIVVGNNTGVVGAFCDG